MQELLVEENRVMMDGMDEVVDDDVTVTRREACLKTIWVGRSIVK